MQLARADMNIGQRGVEDTEKSLVKVSVREVLDNV